MRRRSRSPAQAAAEPGVERDALRELARRPLSAARLRERLSRAGHASAEIERACERLAAGGQLDDRRLAEHWILTRAERLGHGPERLIEDLVRSGVPRAVAEEAWAAAVARGDIEPAALLARQIARRLALCPRPLDRRSAARVYNALLRSGFPAEAVAAALAPHGLATDFPDDDTDGGSADDVP